MTNLPITQPPARASFSGESQPAKDRARPSPPGGAPLSRSEPSATSGNTANASPRNSSPDDQIARATQRSGGADAAQEKVGSELPGAGAASAGIAEPFSELLARQIGEAGSATPITTQDTLAIGGNTAAGGTAPTAKETQDLTAIDTSASADTASILAAMLLQTPAAEGKLRNGVEPAGVSLAGARSSAEPGKMLADDFRQATGKPAQAEIPLPVTDSKQLPEAAGLISLSSEVIEHAKSAANSASLPQAITPSSLSAVMPNMQSNNATGTTQTITTPLGSNAWTEEFTQKISWMYTQRNQVAELHLNPPDLGPLDVVLKISGNQATVLFTSPHGAVRDAVENALPKLREVLADNGIMLGNATVSDQSRQDRSADGNQGFGTAAQRALLDAASDPTGSSAANSQTGSMRRHNGMVDTFA